MNTQAKTACACINAAYNRTMTEQKQGRPTASDEEARKIQTFVSLTREERDALERLAEQEGRTVSGQIRFLVRGRLQESEMLSV